MANSPTGNTASVAKHFRFPSDKVEVAVVLTPEEKTVELQNAMIAEYEPTLNVAGKPKGFFETIFGGFSSNRKSKIRLHPASD